MTRSFAPAVRLPKVFVTQDIEVVAPPEVARPSSSGVLVRLLPAFMSVASLGVMAAGFSSGSAVTRNPTFLALPMMLLISTVVAALIGRGRGPGAGIDADRVDYLGYLSDLRATVTETAAAQRSSLHQDHPGPDTLWPLIGGPRMWERCAADSDFCLVRIGVGTRPLTTRLVAPETRPPQWSDPVTTAALRRFLDTHSAIAEVPVAIPLRSPGSVTIDGDPIRVRALLRAMLCQLAVLHGPDQLWIVAAISDHRGADWDWLKWLPHNQHPSATDAAGSVRMVYPSMAEAAGALIGVGARPHAVVVCDLEERATSIEGASVLEVGNGGDGAPVTMTCPGATEALSRPDQLDPADALTCARRLAAYRVGGPARRDGIAGRPDPLGIGDADSFDPNTLWRGQNHRDRLCAPIGTTTDGLPLQLDIKEPAEHGMGPHGLCIGATGSGKSELLRTVTLGMMSRNSPEVLNLLLIDFKGGATFLDLARAPHVAAVITNLSEEAPLVARMRDALAGEMNRRQQLLRAAGNFVSVAAYEDARRAGAQLTALPTLFIVVDEFSELLSQHPDFAETFVAIGRVGRSLGMHLLLASQRLDEGRLRGLEAHLSYRICLKTLSASDSRTVLGTLDAHQLPNTPGAGFLRSATGELIRFQTAFVSGPHRAPATLCRPASPSVSLFTTRTTGPVAIAEQVGQASAPTMLRAVLDRLSGLGPPAHQVWLPPLEASPGLHTLLRGPGRGVLTVPIGVVDRPFDQCRTPLTVDLSGAAGNVAIVGAPRSGKSTAVRTLITALAATHDPGQVQFYCLDFGGGTLDSLRTLPQVGDVASRAEPQLVLRMVAELESMVRSREVLLRDHGSDTRGHVFLVVDGWATLRHEFGGLEESITALAAQGLSFGVHVVVSASRWAEMRPSLKDQLGTRIELRLGDPADSEVDRMRARLVPPDRPGRGLSREGLHMLIAVPGDHVEPSRGDGESAAPPIPLLPIEVGHEALLLRAGNRLGAGILLGVEERRLHSVTVAFERQPHLLIIGDNQCGKTSALRMLCREIVRTKTAAQAQLLIVDFRRTLLGVVESQHLGGYAMSPAALTAVLPDLAASLQGRMPPADLSHGQLLTRSWWSGPDFYVVVDDYDLVATPAGNPLLPLLEYLPYATDLGLHLIVARRSGGAARGLFEPLLASLRDLGCAGLMMSGSADEGTTLGSGRTASLPPGRGVLATGAGDERLVQVAWSPPL